MRTVPSAISTGLSAGTRMFYLVRLTWRDGAGSETTKYFTTASKNLAGNTMTLKETSGGGSLTYDATVIAGADWTGGEFRPLAGIGEFEQAVDLDLGGGVAQMSDGKLLFLNPQYSGSNRFDQAVLGAPTYLENATVKIYMGFIPAGATPSVVIADDMLLRWSGIVEDAHDFDHQTLQLSCVDGSELRHRDIPEETVSINDYPRCPKENLGRVIPLLYGDFSSGTEFNGLGNTESVKWSLQDMCPAPGICVDYFEMKYVFASHVCHTFSQRTFQYASEIDAYGGLFAGSTGRDSYTFTRSNTSSGCFITYRPDGIGLPVTEWRQPVRYRNSETAATYADSQFINTIDRDATTKAQIFPTDVYAYNCDAPYGAGSFVTDEGVWIRLNPTSETIYLRAVIERAGIFATGAIKLYWKTNEGVTLSESDVTIGGTDMVNFAFEKEAILYHGTAFPIMDTGYISENTFGVSDTSFGSIGGNGYLYGLSVVYFTVPIMKYDVMVVLSSGQRVSRRGMRV